MNRVVLFVFLLLFSFSSVVNANEYENALSAIEENAGTGEHGLPKDIVALLKAKERLVLLAKKDPHIVVPIIVDKLQPTWRYSKRGAAYRIALLEVLVNIGNTATEDIIPSLQIIADDIKEKNQYVKMQAKAAIMAIKDKGNYVYGASNYIPAPDFLKKDEEGQILFSDLTVVKYLDMKKEYGIEGVVELARQLPKNSQITLARIMANDNDVFAAYQGALILKHNGLEEESFEQFVSLVHNIYRDGSEDSGRIIYSMIHVLDDKLLNNIFYTVRYNVLTNLDNYSDDEIDNLFKAFELKKGENLKIEVDEKREILKKAIKN